MKNGGCDACGVSENECVPMVILNYLNQYGQYLSIGSIVDNLSCEPVESMIADMSQAGRNVVTCPPIGISKKNGGGYFSRIIKKQSLFIFASFK